MLLPSIPHRPPVLPPGLLWFGADDPRNAHSANPDDEVGTSARVWRALIVEDEIYIALHLEGLLMDMGLEVAAIAATAREALDAAKTVQPDVIFMDVNLRGGMDGIDAAWLAREVSDAPVIFVTAYGDDATKGRMAAYSAESPLVEKPPMIGALQAALKKVGRSPKS